MLAQVNETLIFRVLLLGIAFFTHTLIARALGPEGRGVFAAAMTTGFILVQFGTFGLNISNSRFVAEHRSQLSSLFGNSLVFAFLFGGISSLLALALFVLFPQWAPGSLDLLMWPMIAVPFGILGIYWQQLLIGISDFRFYNLSEVSQKLFFTLAILWVYWSSQSSSRAFLIFNCVSFVILCFFLLWRLRSQWKCKFQFSWALFIQYLPYSLKSHWNGLFSFLLVRQDLIMVKVLSNDKQAGLYSVAAMMADLLYLIPSVTGAILFPRLAQTSNPKERWLLARKTMFGMVGVVLLQTAAVAVLGRWTLTTVFGSEYQDSVSAFYILTLAMGFYGVSNISSVYLAACGSPRWTLWVWSGACAGNFLMNYLLIPRWGLNGAAFASLIGYAGVFVLQLWGIQRGRYAG